MDLNITKETVCINEIMYEGSVEQAIDSDVTLPDYCPDILRVLKCTIMPRVNSTQVAGDRITVDGTALIRAMYVDEDDHVHCYEQSIPFSKYIEQKEMDKNPFMKVRVKCEYVNCRAVSQRRLDIHGSVAICFMMIDKKCYEIMTDIDGAGMQTKKKDIEMSDMVGNTTRVFTLSDVMEIGASKPPVGQIIRTNACACMNEMKVINNKAMIKGDMTINIMYCADTSEGTLETIESSIPISQVVELTGLTEECMTDVRLDLISMDVIPKSDTSGEMRMLDMCSRIECVMSASKMMTMPVIIDAYSTDYDIDANYKMMEFKKFYDEYSETTLCREQVDVSGVNVKKVLDMWCTDVTSSAHQRDEDMVIRGCVTVCMLVMDDDNQVGYLERQVNYEHSKNMGTKEKMECDPYVTVCASNFVIGADDCIDVRIEMKMQASIFMIETCRMMDSITVEEEKGMKKKKSALTIYFTTCEEHVWEIARKYNTTVDAIMKENDMNDDMVSDNTLLLIPGV